MSKTDALHHIITFLIKTFVSGCLFMKAIFTLYGSKEIKKLLIQKMKHKNDHICILYSECCALSKTRAITKCITLITKLYKLRSSLVGGAKIDHDL